MSRPGPLRLLIKNWKTSIFLVPSASFALWYTFDYTSTNSLMRSFCRRASVYGDERLRNPTAPTRHITVILNPVANRGKSKKLYEKWVEPLLNLAGIKVSLVETRSPNEAFELMKIMTNCDGVAIVGGDGTVHEAINGLLHRPDRAKAIEEFPIAIIPAGQYNSIARYIHQGYVSYRNQKEFLMVATSKLVDSTTTKFDTLKISSLNESSKSESPTYALRDIRYGLYQDSFYKLSGYHYYQQYIKPLWQRLQRTFSNKYSLPKIDSVSFTEPCIGCKNCHERHKLHNDSSSIESEKPSNNRKWWSIMAPINRTNAAPSEKEKRESELQKRDNPDCGAWIDVGSPQDITDFRACMMGDKKVRLSLSRSKEYTPSDITETQDIRLRLSPEIDNQKSSQMKVKSTDLSAKELEAGSANDSADKEAVKDGSAKFLIDGQPLQAQSIEITTLSEAIKVFTGPYKIVVKSNENRPNKR